MAWFKSKPPLDTSRKFDLIEVVFQAVLLTWFKSFPDLSEIAFRFGSRRLPQTDLEQVGKLIESRRKNGFEQVGKMT